EQTISDWRRRHGITVETNYEAERLRKKERQLNPAYQPGFSLEDAERIAEVLPTLDSLSFSLWNDRPLRSLAVLQFCPALSSLSVAASEIADWSPLRHVPGLETLHIVADDEAVDLRPVGKLGELKILHVTLDCPWPDLGGWEDLVQLEELHFQGNILALREVPRLPALRRAKIHKREEVIPLRTVSDLPEMPELRSLFLENTWRLEGMERYPHLVNLTVFGMFRDLAPLAALSELTDLLVSGSAFKSLEPLAQLGNLRRLTVRRELPQDYTPLAALPHLHEVRVELCPSSKLEIATLQAGLAPWSDEFTVDPPRPLRPLRLRLRSEDARDPLPEVATTPRDWGDDKEMAQSEARWFAREINRRLNALLGKGWGGLGVKYGLRAGYDQLRIGRPEDVDQLPHIIDTVRAVMASARHHFKVLLCLDTMERFERDLDEIEQDDEAVSEEREDFDAERKREEWEYSQERQRERREFMERLHRFRLRQEQGLPVDPMEFAAEVEEPEEVAAGG
ncbi:MAG: hypothetical protein ABI992_13915, partial [Chthoniobacterales bacterium]